MSVLPEEDQSTTKYDGGLIKNGKYYARVLKGGASKSGVKIYEGTYVYEHTTKHTIDCGFMPDLVYTFLITDNARCLTMKSLADDFECYASTNPRGTGGDVYQGSSMFIHITDNGFIAEDQLSSAFNGFTIKYKAIKY